MPSTTSPVARRDRRRRSSRTHVITAAGRALADLAGRRRPMAARSTPLMRVWAVNGTQVAWVSSPAARSRSPYCGLGQHDDRAPFGGLVGQRRQLGGVGQLVDRARRRPGRTRWPAGCPRVIVPVLSSSRVLTSPAASTARPLIASTLRCTRRSMPAMPIADSSAPIVVGIRQTSSDTSTMPVMPLPSSADVSGMPGWLALAKIASGCRVDGGQQEDDRQRGEQDVQRDLVRRLLPAGALDQGDHPVDEALARLLGDLDDDAVRQHLRAAGDRVAVAAALADHRRALTGDRALVDAGDAVDDVAVAGDDVAGLADDPVALAAVAAPGPASSAPVKSSRSTSRRAIVSVLARRNASACALPRPFGDRLGQVGEETVSHSQTDDQPGERRRSCRSRRRS